MPQDPILRVPLREIVFSTFSPNRERTWVRFPVAYQTQCYRNPGLQHLVAFLLRLTEALQYQKVIKDRAVSDEAEARLIKLPQRRLFCQTKKLTMYFPATKSTHTHKIILMMCAGTYFWHRAPRYIPSKPPSPNRMPRYPSGAMDSAG